MNRVGAFMHKFPLGVRSRHEWNRQCDRKRQCSPINISDPIEWSASYKS